MALRNFKPSEDEYHFIERQLSVQDNDMVFAIVLCVIILGGICLCIKINSWVTAAKLRDRELNDARVDWVGGKEDDDEEALSPSKPPKKDKAKKKKKHPSSDDEKTEKRLSKSEALQESAKS